MKKVTSADNKRDNELQALKGLKKMGYDEALEVENRNTDKYTFKRLYVEAFCMSILLDLFILKEKMTIFELEKGYWLLVPKYFVWNVPVVIFGRSLTKVVRLGYIEVVETDVKEDLVLQITELGISTLQQQTLSNLAATNFSNFQAHKFNYRSFLINMLAIALALLSIVIAIIALKFPVT